MFSINFRQLASQYLTNLLRKTKQLSWLYALVKPLTNLYNDFAEFSTEVLYELRITCQVIYLEKLLNDKFNNGMVAYAFDNSSGAYSPVYGAIYIVDSSDIHEVRYLWLEVEERPAIYLYQEAEVASPRYFYTQAEYEADTDFAVMIPTSVGDVNDVEFKASVDAWIVKYKLAGKRYKLLNY